MSGELWNEQGCARLRRQLQPLLVEAALAHLDPVRSSLVLGQLPRRLRPARPVELLDVAQSDSGGVSLTLTLHARSTSPGLVLELEPEALWADAPLHSALLLRHPIARAPRTAERIRQQLPAALGLSSCALARVALGSVLLRRLSTPIPPDASAWLLRSQATTARSLLMRLAALSLPDSSARQLGWELSAAFSGTPQELIALALAATEPARSGPEPGCVRTL